MRMGWMLATTHMLLWGALLSGCAREAGPTAAAPAAPAAPDAPASAAVVLPPLAAYVCPNGLLMEVESDAAAGTLTMAYGETRSLAFRAAGTGAETYVAGEMTIRVAPDAMLVTAGRLAEMACPRRPQTPTVGVVWGTLSKLDRMGLPPGTRAQVALEDVSRAGARGIVLATTTVTTVGNQVPLHFLLTYEPETVLDRNSYTLRARVEAPDGQLLYVTDTHIPVFESGPAPAPLDLMLVPARP
jgi:uncharacterized lipoprotein YbaY